MSLEMTRIPVMLAVLKWAGAVAGAGLGLGVVAFLVGFQAQRAQYELAQAPLVFIDYWSCAEVGAVAVLDSLYVAVTSPLMIFGLVGLSVAIFLLLEWDRFRALLLRPIPNFICLLALLGSLLVTLRQQLTPFVAPGTSAAAVDAASPPDSVPMQWPFTAFIPERAALPAGEDFTMPATSVEAWNAIAKHVENTDVEQARYLLLRPRPMWARAPSAGAPEAPEDFLGVTVKDENLDESRARSLYSVILKAFMINSWILLFAWLWNRRILRELQAARESLPAGRWARLAYLLREEFWYCSGIILLPLAAFLMLCSTVILPTNYGMLAFSRLGQDYAEVFVRGQAPERGRRAPGSAEEAPADGAEPSDISDKALALAFDYGVADSVHERTSLHDQWEKLVTALEREATPVAAETLQRIAQMATPIAPTLADEAQKGWLRVAASTTSRRSGYILHYPRSEQVLRILEADRTSMSGWSVLPIPMDRVLEIHVQSQQRDHLLATLLSQMDGSNDGERSDLLLEVLRLGHALTLEVFMAALRDPSPQIRGDATTRVGALASSLGHDPTSELRRRRARHLLLEVLRGKENRLDFRAGAVTSLSRLASLRDPLVCAAFLELVKDDGLNGRDRFWELRGTAITGLGQLRCETAAMVLADMLGDASVPVEARSAIPAALLSLGDDERTISVLTSLIREPQTKLQMLWPAISTLGSVRGGSTRLSVVTLCEFLDKIPEREFAEESRELLQRMALGALNRIGDREAIRTLERIAQDPTVKEDIRLLSLWVMEDLASPEASGMLLDLAEDTKAPEKVRSGAIMALSGFAEDDALLRLKALYQTIRAENAKSRLLGVIRNTFEMRGNEGSGLARYILNEVSQSTSPASPMKPLDAPGEALVGPESGPEAPADGSTPFANPLITQVSDESFVSALASASTPVFLMAWAPWCHACKATIPAFERMATEYEGQIEFMAIDVDANESVGAALPFSGIPGFVLLNGGKFLDIAQGRMSEDEMRAFLKAAPPPRTAAL